MAGLGAFVRGEAGGRGAAGGSADGGLAGSASADSTAADASSTGGGFTDGDSAASTSAASARVSTAPAGIAAAGSPPAPSWNALVSRASARLAEAAVDSPMADARAIAEHVAGRSLALAAPPTPAEARDFEALLARRIRREPLQHILATMYFRYLELACRPGVFVVRPETEVLAGHAIDAARQALATTGRATVADLCTGSGAIAIAVATEVPESSVTAVDISPAAIALARENSERYGGLVDFAQEDATGALAGQEGSFDVVVSNPPYIPPGQAISPEVAADPPQALWGGGADGLDVPWAIVERGRQLLAPGGVLLVEHDESQGSAMRDCALSLGLSGARTLADLAGRPRMLWARLG